jgi:hypothetical protein
VLCCVVLADSQVARSYAFVVRHPRRAAHHFGKRQNPVPLSYSFLRLIQDYTHTHKKKRLHSLCFSRVLFVSFGCLHGSDARRNPSGTRRMCCELLFTPCTPCSTGR